MTTEPPNSLRANLLRMTLLSWPGSLLPPYLCAAGIKMTTEPLRGLRANLAGLCTCCLP